MYELKKFIVPYVALLCFFMLSTSFYVWGSNDPTSFLSFGTIKYVGKRATLRFKSGFETGVAITHSGDGQRSSLHGADSTGFDWDNIMHLFNYVAEGSYPNHVDTRLDSNPPVGTYDGNGSLYLEQTDYDVVPVRNALEIGCHDGNAGAGSERIQNMSETYYSYWMYLPSDFELNSGGGGWMVINSVREYSTGYQGDSDRDFSVVFLIYQGATQGFYWRLELKRYDPYDFITGWSHFDVEVPLGQWFHVEQYVKRHLTDGIVKMWVNGVSVFNITGIRTRDTTSDWAYKIKLTTVMSAYSGADQSSFPLYAWFDDVEIWDGIP